MKPTRMTNVSASHNEKEGQLLPPHPHIAPMKNPREIHEKPDQESVNKILSILEERNEIRRGTERIRDVLESMGNPEQSFRIIMVGGTNGKTSTCYFITHLLRKAGLHIGTFTSPHPENMFREIQINENPIQPNDYSRLIMKYADSDIYLTSFELKVCAALDYFREQKIDAAIMEMGMGGKEDAVNVRSPDLAVITNVGMDHTDHLGVTLEAIAFEKGDIIPENGCVITTARSPSLKILKRISMDRHSQLITPEYEEYLPYLYHLMVDHHKENAALAMEAVLRFSFSHPEIIPKKVTTLNLLSWAGNLIPPEGRFQVIPLGNEIRLILDGAHNLAGFRALFRDLARFVKRGTELPLVVIVGILRDKDIPGMAELTKNFRGKFFCTTQSTTQRGEDPEILAAEFRKYHHDVFVAPTVREALEMGRLMLSEKGGLMLVTGSLYTVADGLEWVESMKEK